MTYKVLLHALKDCPKADDCSFCPHTDHCDGLKNLCTDALNTIKRQQKQIESMKNKYECKSEIFGEPLPIEKQIWKEDN